MDKILKRIWYYGEAVMFSHTLFSLPFAALSVLVAANGIPPYNTIIWILIALVSGRNGANAINRFIDKEIDKKNPRTADRHLPSGKLKSIEIIIITVVCYIVFIYAAYRINRLCFYLSPLAIFLFTFYSYTKRFTWLCHLVLGITCSGAPVGGWIAITGSFSIEPFILAGAVALWVAGFDIIYGTQDIKFDRDNKIYSIPAKFGYNNALLIAKYMHACMIFLLLVFGIITNLTIFYFIGVLIVIPLLMIEHKIINPKSQLRMKIASYNLNQIISLIILIFGAIDILLK